MEINLIEQKKIELFNKLELYLKKGCYTKIEIDICDGIAVHATNKDSWSFLKNKK